MECPLLAEDLAAAVVQLDDRAATVKADQAHMALIYEGLRKIL